MDKLLLIDSSALIYRGYYALPHLTRKGESVNAVYGFFSILIKALEENKPDYVIATFDRKEKTFRHDIFEDYKAQRPDMPEDLVSQLPRIREGLEEFEIPCLDKKGFEADDIIATLSEKWKEKVKVVILTGDRDLLQLVEENVSVLSPGNGIKEVIEFNEEKVIEKYGIKPSLFVDYKAFRGDSSDNIPGVKGIGKKRAAHLIDKFGTVEEIYSSVEDVKPALARRIKGKKEDVLKNKKLVSLRKDLDLEISLQEAKLDYKDEQVLKFFEEMNFKRFIEKYGKSKNQTKLEL